MTYFRFEDPWLLLFLLLIPWTVAMSRRGRMGTLRYSSISKLKTLRPSRINILEATPVVLRCMAIALIVLAFARPQEGRKTSEILSPGVDIVLALDTSGSMRALDFKKKGQPVDRLEVVKDVVTEFVKEREFDRIGMVAFGKEAFTQCPLTLDHNILLTFLDKLKIGIAGDMTAIGNAIGIAVKRLKDIKSQSKIIILLTDGRNNAGTITPIQAAEIAKTFGIKIYTIGVGTRGKAPFLVESFFGKRYVYQDVELDEETLKQVWLLRRMVTMITSGSMESTEATEKVMERMKKTSSNKEFLSTLSASAS
ncbi:MAG: VWA domain-containing protein [Nitrospinae bacterium]|nr:VWA domain-containing protein [Nitrospinota bacterium]